VPNVVRRLYDEHRCMEALLRLLDEKSAEAVHRRINHYYLLRDIVAYLNDYPEAHHHPIEERIGESLIRRKPSAKKIVAALHRDHQTVSSGTCEMIERLDAVISAPSPSRVRSVHSACRIYVQCQRAHLQAEHDVLFPAALDSLREADWREINSRYDGADDPLFGESVSSRHRVLYEFLIARVDGPRKNCGLFSAFSRRMLARSPAESWRADSVSV
jgi:hemerythrin-like domain-containing protein